MARVLTGCPCQSLQLLPECFLSLLGSDKTLLSFAPARVFTPICSPICLTIYKSSIGARERVQHPLSPLLTSMERLSPAREEPVQSRGDLPSAPSSCSCFDFQYVLPSPQMAAEETFPRPTVLARPLGFLRLMEAEIGEYCNRIFDWTLMGRTLGSLPS